MELDSRIRMISRRTFVGDIMERKTHRDQVWVQEGDLGRVKVDVAIGSRLVESGPHEVWKIGWDFQRRHHPSRIKMVKARRRNRRR